MDSLRQQLLLENPDNDQEALIQEFMKLYGGKPGESNEQTNQNYQTVNPVPDFCIKTKSDNGGKVFLNICTAEHIPEPRDITDAELIQLLDSDDPSQYRVPMSLGEPHAEVDKSGSGCTVYDVVIAPKFCSKLQTNNLFMGFFMSVIVEGLENKYNLKLTKEWIKLKNKKCMGSIVPQHIRTASKPWIMEMGEQQSKTSSTNPQSSTKPTKKAPEPKYKIVQEPTTGHPEFLIAEIHLPEVKTSRGLELDIGEDCIKLDTRSKVYYLEIYLPYNLIQEDCGAQFDKQSHKLTITMPVQQPVGE